MCARSRRTTSRPQRHKSPGVEQPAEPEARLVPVASDWRHIALIVVVALALRAVYFVQLSQSLPFSTLVTDSRVYDDWAQRIAAGDWIGQEAFYQSPLYPYTMALVYRCTGYDPMHVRYLQAFLGAVACGLVALAGQAFFGHRPGRAAGWLLACYPPALFFDGLIQKSSLDLFFMSATLAGMGWFLIRQRWYWLLGLGVALGLLILNRENARLLLPVIAAWLMSYFHQASWRQRGGWLAVLVAGCGIVLLPVGLRNYHVSGEFLLSTSQFGPNFYIGNHAGASGLYEPLVEGRSHTIHERADAVRLAEQAVGRPLTAGEVSNYWRDQAVQFMVHSPVAWLRLMIWKSYLVFHGQELVDSEGIEVYARHSLLLRGLLWLSFGVLVPLASLGAWATRLQWRRLLVLYGAVAVLALSVALFFVFARYRYPLVPILAMFAGAGLCAFPQIIAQWRQADFWRRWGPGCAIALALVVPLNWALPEYRDDAIAYANYGKELLDEGRLDRAEEALRLALDIEPNYVGAHHNLGRVLESQGRTGEAELQYQTAIRLNPNYGRSHWMLGRLSLAAGHGQAAIDRLRTASTCLPDVPELRVDLAYALLAAERPHEAVEQLRIALQLDPTSAAAANNLSWLLATSPDPSLRDGDEALRWAKLLEPLDNPYYLDTVAAAYAEAGDWGQAVEVARRGSQLAAAAGDAKLSAVLSQRAELYETGQAYRDLPDSE